MGTQGKLTDDQLHQLVANIKIETNPKKLNWLYGDLHRYFSDTFAIYVRRTCQIWFTDEADAAAVCDNALVEAVKSFDHKLGRFGSFLSLVLKCRLLSYYKSAAIEYNRLKLQSLDEIKSESNRSLSVVVPDRHDYEAEYDDQQQIRHDLAKLWLPLRRKLSPRELVAVIEVIVNDKTYLEASKIIAQIPDDGDQRITKRLTTKSADNAITRATTKAAEIMRRQKSRAEINRILGR